MPRIAAALLGLCLLMTLSGCNMLITDAPLFTEADGPAKPALRNGVWLNEGEPKKPCRVDVRKPVTRWPECADWMLVQDGRMLNFERDKDGVGAWEVRTFIAAAGAPQVLQFKWAINEDAPSESGAGGKTPSLAYSYFALMPTKTDADGKAIATETWPVMCGPEPSDVAKNMRNRYLTEELQPGFVESEQNCTTTSKDAVMAAAAAGRTWNGEPLRARWIRDSYP